MASFVYDPSALQASAHQIRLLRVHPAKQPPDPLVCDLRIATLSSSPKPEFAALSYCWGPPKFDTEIVLNSRRFKITNSLFKALKTFRRTGWQMIWVDQICINQNDADERSSQVGLMDRIYSQALRVFVYLGDEHPHFREEFQFLKDYIETEQKAISSAGEKRSTIPHNYRPSVNSIMVGLVGENAQPRRVNDMTNKVIRGLYGLLDRPYFSRRWILQEVSLGRVITILIGDHTLNIESMTPFSYIVDILATFYTSADAWQNIDRDAYLRVAYRVKTVTELCQSFKSNQARKPLWDQFERCVGYQTTNAKDQIYALLSLASDAGTFPPPDYSKTTAQIYLEFCKKVVSEGQGMRVIEATCSVVTGKRTEFPSWGLWLEDFDLENFNDLQVAGLRYHVSHPTTASIRVLEGGTGLHILGQVSDEVVDLDAGLPGPSAATAKLTKTEVRDALDWIQSTLVFISSWLRSNPSETQSTEGVLAKLLNQTQSSHDFQAELLDLEDFLARSPASDLDNEFPERIMELIKKLFTSNEFDTTAKYTTNGLMTWTFQLIPQRIISTVAGGRIFVTKGLQIGITKSPLGVGDRIAIFAGGKMPFILRPHLGEYKLVGYAYIEGLPNFPPKEQDITTMTNLTIH